MDKRYFFERNLLCLSDPDLCKRLSGAETGYGNYTFLESRSGELVPAIVDNSGKAHPLHSMIDPVKEGSRLLSTVDETGFLVIFGLGGAFHISAALERKDIIKIVVVDFNIHGIAELLASKEYVSILKDKRVSLVIDPPASWMEAFIVSNYKPALSGGISVLPLRTRTDLDLERFNSVYNEIKTAIDYVSSDFSVQSMFGKRWFSNIINNLKRTEQQKSFLPTIQRAAIIAAGPSLDIHFPLLEKKRSSLCIISTDTALPAVLERGITPDAVISIDCQHVSSYHFIGTDLKTIPLFLDMASPSVIAAHSDNPHFFTSGHPLCQYISQYWKHFPFVDTSGGNVSYAALSLADVLGAKTIDLYGVDFSYAKGNSYARGTYIHKLFANKQNRLMPAESQFNHFLYRNTSLQKVRAGKTWYYQTNMLKDYYGRFERKALSISAGIRQIEGIGVSINIPPKKNSWQNKHIIFPFSAGIASMTAFDFLEQFHDDIQKLSLLNDDFLILENTEPSGLNPSVLNQSSLKEHHLFLTLLPLSASFKKEYPHEDMYSIFEMTKVYALHVIEKVFSAGF